MTTRRSAFRGTGALLRLGLRFDRVRLPLWVLGILALVVLSAWSIIDLYGHDPAGRVSYAAVSLGNPTIQAINGPGLGLADGDLGPIVSNETMVWAATSAAFMSIFLLTRHTRGEEEAERTDLVRSRVVGRHAPLAAAVLLTAGSSVLVGVVTLAGLLATDLPVAGSVAFAASVTATGLVFAGVAAVTAQLTTSARGALGFGVGAIGAAYGLRAVGDVTGGGLSWASPLGWSHRVRPWADEQWWVLALGVVTALALVGIAARLSERRDLGSGLIQPRLGPATAASGLLRPLGLPVRLLRGSIAGWSIGLFVLGVLYGSFGRDVEQMLADNPELSDYLRVVEGVSLTDSYLSYTLLMGALLAAGFAVSSVLRLRTEETTGRTELVLARPTGRLTQMGRHLLVSVAGTLTVLVASGAGTGIGLAVSTADAGQVGRMTLASVALLPATLVLVGASAALFALAPRMTGAAWGALAFVLLVGLLGDVLRLPGWLRDLSPYEHLARTPAEPFAVGPAVALLLVAAALTTAALAGFRHRDVPTI